MTKADRTLLLRGRMLAQCIILLLWIASLGSGQDDGQAAAHLQTLVNGTLPNGAQFRAASTSITSNDSTGILTVTKVGLQSISCFRGCLTSQPHCMTKRALSTKHHDRHDIPSPITRRLRRSMQAQQLRRAS